MKYIYDIEFKDEKDINQDIQKNKHNIIKLMEKYKNQINREDFNFLNKYDPYFSCFVDFLIINNIPFIKDIMYSSCFPFNYNITSIVIPNSVKEIGEGAFKYCIALKSVIIPGSVKEINNYAFSHCMSLKSIVIPDSVELIGEKAFEYCEYMESITISNSIKKIGAKAFYGCDNLKNIYFKGTKEEWDKIKIYFEKDSNLLKVKFI